MSLSKDQVSNFDPSVKSVRVKDGFINLTLQPNTVILTVSETELHQMTKLLQESKSGI